MAKKKTKRTRTRTKLQRRSTGRGPQTARKPCGQPLDDIPVGTMVDVANQDRYHYRENQTYKFVWVKYKGQLVPLHFTDHAVSRAAGRTLRAGNLVDVPRRKLQGIIKRLTRLIVG